MTSVKAKLESLRVLLDAEDGAKGSFPLKGSPGPFLLWNGSMTSEVNDWKGSHGLEGSAGPVRLTGVVLPESIKDIIIIRHFDISWKHQGCTELSL